MNTVQTEKAIAYFKTGFMCLEAVIAAYSEAVGLSSDVALKIAGGFAGGMAQGLTCGAVSGAFMVIGLKYGAGITKDQFSRDFCFQLVQEFSHRFEERRGTINCCKLLEMNGVDYYNPEEMKKLRAKGICEGIVRDASEILEDLIYENSEVHE